MIPSLGAYGYLQTWINILNLAKEKCYKNILVFDDDIIFDNDFEIKLNKLEEHLSDQANDLMAQIGYESKSTYFAQDYNFYADNMREELNQEDNIKRAQKLNKKDFTNRFVDALKSFEELKKVFLFLLGKE